MSLIKCYECGKEISDTSDKCIHCGASTIEKKTCPECSKEINTNDKICKNCGINLKGISNHTSKKKFLKIFGVILIVVIIIIVIYIYSTVKIPILYNVDVEIANNLLSSNSLIPEIIYEFDDYVEEGKVIDTYPYSSDRILKNSQITLYVSKGPRKVNAYNSNITWYNITTSGKDNWNFNTPYIEEGYLYIKCYEVTFAKNFKWSNTENNLGFGKASINDSFSKTVPVEIIYENQEVVANAKQSITIKIPVNDLDTKKPTTLYLKLIAEENNAQFEISINFAISW